MLAATQFWDGLKSEEGLGSAKDYDKAFQFYSLSADQNYAPAQNALALLYWFGKGVSKNLEKAINYFQKAVQQNNLMACCHLARLYEDGVIKETEHENGRLLRQKVVGINIPEPDPSKPYYQVQLFIYHLEKQWKADCQVKMGCNLLNQQPKQGIYLLLEAIHLCPSTEAMFQIGLHSENTKDEKKAFEFYQKASNLNYEKAYPKIAFCYETGFGTTINLIECLKWFRKAKMEKEVERVMKENWHLLSDLLLKT